MLNVVLALILSILSNQRELDFYVITPEKAEVIGVTVACEHIEKFSGREIKHRQEHFRFTELHPDTYTIGIVTDGPDGRSILVREAYVQ